MGQVKEKTDLTRQEEQAVESELFGEPGLF